jgi:CheY-like chemotaxis protein
MSHSEGSDINPATPFGNGQGDDLTKIFKRSFAPATAFVIEDNDINQMVIEECLSHYGVEHILHAATLGQAHDILASTPPNSIPLMVFDIMLPDGESHDLFEKQRKIHASSKLGIYTARVNHDEIKRYNQLGADFILPKPLSVEDMFEQFDQCFAPNTATG